MRVFRSLVCQSAPRRVAAARGLRWAATSRAHAAGAHAAGPPRRLSVVRPDLVGEWVPELNAMDVSEVPITEANEAVWRCSTCAHQWRCPVRERAIGEAGCPECARRAASGVAALSGESSLEVTHPHLLCRWDTARNGTLRPSDVHELSPRPAWWRSTDGNESFRRPVYAFVHEQRSMREISVAAIHQRVAALKTLAPLCGYDLPTRNIDAAVTELEKNASALVRAAGGPRPLVAGSPRPLVSRSAAGSFTAEDIAGFEDVWSAAFDTRNAALRIQHTRRATDALAVESELLAREFGRPKGPSAAVDDATSGPHIRLELPAAGLHGGLPLAEPVLAMLDFYASELMQCVADAAPSGGAAAVPSFLLDEAAARAYFTLAAAQGKERAASPSRSAQRSAAVAPMDVGSRSSPTAPSPDELIMADVAVVEEGAVERTIERPVSGHFRPSNRTGFRSRASLDMPEDDAESNDQPPPPPPPEVPSAPRVVGRRKS